RGDRRQQPGPEQHRGQPGAARRRGERPPEQAGQAEAFATEAAPEAAECEGSEEDQEERVDLVHALLPAPAARGGGVKSLHGATRGATERALARGHGLLLPPDARLLVVLALAQLGEDASFLALLLEPADCALDGLVLLDPNPCHVLESPPPRAGE